MLRFKNVRVAFNGWNTIFLCAKRGYQHADANLLSSSSTASEENTSEGSGKPQKSPFKKRTSDPQTLREKGDFKRDHMYSKHRPLPDVPWLQDTKRSYMDDAERLYGRKETWASIKDEILREKLAAILKNFLKDTIDALVLEERDARKYKRKCATFASEYRLRVIKAARGYPEPLKEWARSISKEDTQGNTQSSSNLAPSTDDGTSVDDPSIEEDENGSISGAERTHEQAERQEFLEKRRQRGANAVLDNRTALMDLPSGHIKVEPYSSFPFLRKRALEQGNTLDPSLVDWTAKYYPNDDEQTFAHPPKLRRNLQFDGPSSEDVAEDSHFSPSKNAEEPPSPTDMGNIQSPKSHARLRLHRTLRQQEDSNRATFDAEGMFFKVRRQSNYDDQAPKPKAVRGSDLLSRKNEEVVKVPWDTVVKAKEQRHTSDILRAKEHLIRLTRGEDPQTIP